MVSCRKVLQEVDPFLQCAEVAAWETCAGVGVAGNQGFLQLAVLVQDCAGMTTDWAADLVALHAYKGSSCCWVTCLTAAQQMLLLTCSCWLW